MNALCWFSSGRSQASPRARLGGRLCLAEAPTAEQRHTEGGGRVWAAHTGSLHTPFGGLCPPHPPCSPTRDALGSN